MDSIGIGGLLFVVGVILLTLIMVFAIEPKMWTSQIKNWWVQRKRRKIRNQKYLSQNSELSDEVDKLSGDGRYPKKREVHQEKEVQESVGVREVMKK